jgi:hypothetical protein
MIRTVTYSLQQQLNLEANHHNPKGEIEDNHGNRKEYVGITQTPYWNLMFNKQILRIKKRLT